MKHLMTFICCALTFILGIAVGVGFFGHRSTEYQKLLQEDIKHYQQACILSDIVRYSIDNGDTLAEQFYREVINKPELYNMSFKGEELDTLYWCY